MLGSPVAKTDINGNLLWRQSFSSFGEAQTLQDTIGYTGHVQDDENFTYMGARYYDSLTGRFLSIDPAPIQPTLFSSINRYIYANNNPYKYVDPDGRQSMAVVPIISVAPRPEDLAEIQRQAQMTDRIGLAMAVVSMFSGRGLIQGAYKAVTNSAARNPVNAVKLNKQLGSQQQLGEKGVSVAGSGSKTPLRDSKRLANEYGGNASDWSKRSSSQHTASDGRKFETHWYENSATGQRVEPKTIIEDYLKGPR